MTALKKSVICRGTRGEQEGRKEGSGTSFLGAVIGWRKKHHNIFWARIAFKNIPSFIFSVVLP